MNCRSEAQARHTETFHRNANDWLDMDGNLRVRVKSFVPIPRQDCSQSKYKASNSAPIMEVRDEHLDACVQCASSVDGAAGSSFPPSQLYSFGLELAHAVRLQGDGKLADCPQLRCRECWGPMQDASSSDMILIA